MSNRNIIDKLFINLSKWEGKTFKMNGMDTFVFAVYSNTLITIPESSEILESETIIPWQELRTGDLAVYSNNKDKFVGIVIGELERQIAYVDPETAIVRITYYDETIDDYNYINGTKVILDAVE